MNDERMEAMHDICYAYSVSTKVEGIRAAGWTVNESHRDLGRS